jgi:hypothetical protein
VTKHPDNGPTFSKPTIKKPRPPAPSPARQRAELEQRALDAKKSRDVHKRINEVGIVEYMSRSKKPS